MATYKQPTKVAPASQQGKDMSAANTVNMSVGNISRDPNAGETKTSGVKIRGTGAATKGTMARGPMA